MRCEYCNNEYKNLNSLSQHRIRCNLNPNRIHVNSNFINYNKRIKNGDIKHLNQYTKAESLGLEKPRMNEETKMKISEYSRSSSHSEATRKKISSSMIRIVREKPDVYSSSNINGRSKKSLYKGYVMDSSWELKFAIWCDSKKIEWVKNKVGFEYEWEGIRMYYPDFYLKGFYIYVEVKGYEREKDYAKWKSVPNLSIVKKNEIRMIINNTFQEEHLLIKK